MKYLKTIILLLSIGIVYFIYVFANNPTFNYISLGDGYALGLNQYEKEDYGYSDYIVHSNPKLKIGIYTKKYAEKTKKIDELRQDIILNKKIMYNNQNLGIKKTLTEANLITISIGMNDLLTELEITKKIIVNEKSRINIINKIGAKLELLLKEVQKYNKNIVIIGYYNPYPHNKFAEDMFIKLNNKYKSICQKNDIIYIDISKIVNSKEMTNRFSIYPTPTEYRLIYNEIMKKIDI